MLDQIGVRSVDEVAARTSVRVEDGMRLRLIGGPAEHVTAEADAEYVEVGASENGHVPTVAVAAVQHVTTSARPTIQPSVRPWAMQLAGGFIAKQTVKDHRVLLRAPHRSDSVAGELRPCEPLRQTLARTLERFADGAVRRHQPGPEIEDCLCRDAVAAARELAMDKSA